MACRLAAKLVNDYLNPIAHLVTLDEAQQVAETNRIEAAAAAKAARKAAKKAERARGDGGAVSGAGSDELPGEEQKESAGETEPSDKPEER